MSRLWLTPVLIDDEEQSLTLLADRLELRPADASARFLALMKSIHPRLLLTFKANLLLSEDSELNCGVDEIPFDMANKEPVVFGQGPLTLSHCAQAYMDRLPSSKEMKEWLERAEAQAAIESYQVREWIDTMLSWHQSGYAIVLLKEDI